MSYHDAAMRFAWDDDFDYDPEEYLNDEEEDIDYGDEDLDDVGHLRERITDAMPEGDPEAYMASGKELLNELLANPDRKKLSLILDKEIEELRALLGDTGDIDLDGLKEAAMAAFDVSAKDSGPNKGAVMSALASIKEAAAKALRSLGLVG